MVWSFKKIGKVIMSKSMMGIRHELEKLDNLIFTKSGVHNVVLL